MRRRWKSIKRMAREGPVRCYTRWQERRERLGKMIDLDAPEVLLAYFASLQHDAAVAVKLSVPLARVDADRARVLACRERVASEGYEMTPLEYVANVRKVGVTLRDGLREKGWPMPDDPDAVVELLRWMKGATE